MVGAAWKICWNLKGTAKWHHMPPYDTHLLFVHTDVMISLIYIYTCISLNYFEIEKVFEKGS